ncbi:hypothetical protein OF829_17705 [Sphingomonas sp. LB-2]|uniref:surface-adhesin E family protein n=1 Tax=Sphingomonas caeni TaxID=2984949 RepID=UPI0022320AE1|nr:surface-adhesin E family protein [Sphingomonas caeni]MCW3849078.1 hypothetical protein [Sphingomonas caeni]
MHKLLLAAALTLFPAAAHAEDWVLVSVAESRMGAFFVDVDSIETDGAIRSGRVLAVLRLDDHGRAAALSPISFDCKGRRRMIGEGDDYDINGAVVRHTEPATWRDIQPGTTYEELLEMVCGEKPFGDRHFGSKPPIGEGRALLEAGDS